MSKPSLLQQAIDGDLYAWADPALTVSFVANPRAPWFSRGVRAALANVIRYFKEFEEPAHKEVMIGWGKTWFGEAPMALDEGLQRMQTFLNNDPRAPRAFTDLVVALASVSSPLPSPILEAVAVLDRLVPKTMLAL